MSGSAADAGLDYQAQATAFVAVCALTGQPLDWFDDATDIPTAVSAETGGPGDDIRIELVNGGTLETQAKHGLDKDSRFWSAIARLAEGLTGDGRLRAILLVDNTSSRTISPSFRDDLIRGGRADQEKEITAEVRRFLNERGFAPDVVFPRLRIVQNDYDIGSSGVAAAHALLRQVLASSEDVSTAWRVLVDEGHKLIKHRGRRDTASIARLLARHVALAHKSTEPAIVAQNYCIWLAEKTETYYVPGLGVSLPIDSGWIELRALKDQQDRRPFKSSLEKMVLNYHEWERLAEDYIHHDKLDVEQLQQIAKRCVILGGPGSGKSTLARRLAHQLAKQGRIVLLVRLKLLAKLLDGGKPFDEALFLASSEGSGLSTDALQSALACPDYLVADGLDECDPQRAEIGERLKAWCDGHVRCRVIVTTRPIGHDPGLLPGFEHFELLPLDTFSVREHSRRLFDAVSPDKTQAAEQWTRFITGLEEETKDLGKRVRTLAVRNPLLLGFLVRLQLDGLDAARNRSILLSQILQLMEKTTDPAQQPRPNVSSLIAHACLDAIGWQLIESPLNSVDDLLSRSELDLVSKCLPNEAPELASAAFRFWEASRAIERLTAGHLEAVVFVHPVLGEFAAGRRAVGLSSSEFDAWIHRVRRQARWYQTILLAAGMDQKDRVVRTLLSLGDPLDACSTEAKSAASALADGAIVSDATQQKVIYALTARLTSPIPVVSIESALSLMPIARFAADVIAGPTEELRQHEQEWTRVASLAVSTASGKGSLAEFEEWFRTFELDGALEIGGVSVFARFCRQTSPAMPEEAVELYHQLVEIGVKRMIAERPRAHVEEFFDTLEHTEGLSMRMLKEIEDALRTGRFEKQASAIRDRHWNGDKDQYEWMCRASRRENDVLLNCLLTACTPAEPGSAEITQERFSLVCAIVQAMRFGESLASDFVHIREAVDCEAISEAMRGVIIALGFDMREVAAEAASALRRNENDFLLSFLRSKTPTDPDWSRAAHAGLRPDLLDRAIRHPHRSIAYAATMLVDAGAAGAETEQLVLNLLKDGAAATLRFAAHLAISVLGASAGQIILERLRTHISAGCEHLVRALIEHTPPEKHPEFLADIGGWLCHPGSRFAAQVANSLDKLDPQSVAVLLPELRRAFEYWTEQGTWCDEHHVQSDTESCSICHFVLPSVRAAVLQRLITLKAVTVDELIGRLDDKQSEVRRTATSALLRAAEEQEGLVETLLEKIGNGQLILSLLNDLSTLPSQILRANEVQFTSLLASPNQSIRCSALQHLTGQWIPREKATSYARAAMQDAAPIVRTQAVRVLRSIESVEQ